MSFLEVKRDNDLRYVSIPKVYNEFRSPFLRWFKFLICVTLVYCQRKLRTYSLPWGYTIWDEIYIQKWIFFICCPRHDTLRYVQLSYHVKKKAEKWKESQTMLASSCLGSQLGKPPIVGRNWPLHDKSIVESNDLKWLETHSWCKNTTMAELWRRSCLTWGYISNIFATGSSRTSKGLERNTAAEVLLRQFPSSWEDSDVAIHIVYAASEVLRDMKILER